MERTRPLHDRVIVKREQAEERTPGGLIIPDGAKERPVYGVIEAVGPGKCLPDGTLQAMSVRVGDRIIFGKYSGTEIKLGGEEYLILREDEILAVSEML